MVLEPITLNEPMRTVLVVVEVWVVVVVVVDVVVDVAVISVLQAVATSATTAIRIRGKNHFFTDLNNFFSFYYFSYVLMLFHRGIPRRGDVRLVPRGVQLTGAGWLRQWQYWSPVERHEHRRFLRGRIHPVHGDER